jgi:hypothetical protein
MVSVVRGSLPPPPLFYLLNIMKYSFPTFLRKKCYLLNTKIHTLCIQEKKTFKSVTIYASIIYWECLNT